jgi:S-adenosylmethionine hydrolase
MGALVTLLTDFGTADGYVAEMKGVIVSRAPAATILDLTHDIPPQDVEAARLALARYWRRFPPGTVHVAIVDPEVGTGRAALAVESDGRFLVGPDNGILSPALLFLGAQTVSIPIPPHASPTFHGRDVFAPAAALLAAGAKLSAAGVPFAGAVIRRTPEPVRDIDGSVRGEVITVDRFGNAVTNLLGAAVRGGAIEVAGRAVPLRRTYAEAAPGALSAVAGSTGLIEIAIRDGDAARSLGIGRGTPVLLRPPRP